MDSIDLNIFEIKALLTFLNDYINEKNISIYEKNILQSLFTACLKLQKAEKEWKEAMSYTD